MAKNEVVMETKGVSKTFNVGEQDVEVLKEVDVAVGKEDFFVIFGPSGSGKSTLLHTMLGLEKPTGGEVIVLGENTYDMTEDEGATFRKTRIGIVYQQPYWIKSLSVVENVAFPLFLMGQAPADAIPQADALLQAVGMKDWREYSPTELSAGQQQRVSLARALINDPVIIVADEPTGNLDTKSGEELMALLDNLNKKEGKTVVMVTHDLEYMKYANRMVRIVDGRIDGEYTQEDRESILEEIMKTKKGTKADHEFELNGDAGNGESEAIKNEQEEAK